jgi:signal transduction histidine kinase
MSKIESFFLNTFLSISIVGTVLALIATVFLNPSNHLVITAQVIGLVANITAYLIRRKYPTASVIILTSIILGTIASLSFKPPHNTSTQLTVIILCGFIHSVMLKDKWLWLMHGVGAICIFLVFSSKVGDPSVRFAMTLNETIPAAISYSILYGLLSFTTYVLKLSYDRVQTNMRKMNQELHDKAYEIETQNEELMQVQDNLNAVNQNLEKIVGDRTTRILHQNEILIKYSYTNAHQLRGPVARLLGLASLYELDCQMEPGFIIRKMVDEAYSIDSVIRQINTNLDSGRLDAGNVIF